MGLLAIFLLLGGTAFAAASFVGSDKTIRGCVSKKGQLTVLKPPAKKCAKGLTAISWNQTGPAGSIGPAGSTGPAGSQGPPGQPGGQGLKGDNGNSPDPTLFGSAVRTKEQRTSQCDTPNNLNPCAPITITVPAGRTYHATVWSSLSFANPVGETSAQAVFYCPAVSGASVGLTCLTSDGTVKDGVSILPGTATQSGPSQSGAAQGDTSRLAFTLGEGTWTFSTAVDPTAALLDHEEQKAVTTVLITDASQPEPPGVPSCPGGATGQTSTSSSGSTSGGASSSGGATSSGCAG
jgi:hypothetical protein